MRVTPDRRRCDVSLRSRPVADAMVAQLGRAETPTGAYHALSFTLLYLFEKCRTGVLLRW